MCAAHMSGVHYMNQPRELPGTPTAGRWVGRPRPAADIALLDEPTPDGTDAWDRLGHRRARAEEFLAWVEENGRFPSTTAEDPRERSLAKWRNNQLSRATGEVLAVFDEVIPGFTGRQVNGLPATARFERRLQELREWAATHQRPPNIRSADAAERALAAWVYDRHADLDETQAAAVETVVAELRSKPRQQRLAELTAFVEQNGRMPSARSADPSERSLYNFIRDQRRKKTDAVPAIEELQQRARRQVAAAGLAARADAFAQWVEKHGRYPSNVSDDPYEALLAGWRIHQLTEASPEKLKFLEERIPGFTRRRTGPDKERFARRVEELAEWVGRHGRRPSARKGDDAERSLAHFIQTARHRSSAARADAVNRVLAEAGLAIT